MKLYIFPLIGIVFKNTVFCFSDNYVYEDALSKPHFQIYFSDQILNNNEIDVLEKESKNEIIKMVSKENNEHYICEIPKVKKEKDKVIRRSNVSNVKNALALLEPLKNKCLYHTNGWWSYEFCYGKSIRQYHIAAKNEPARFNSNYILGKYAKYLELSSGKPEETKELVRVTPNGKSYFTQKFIDGTKCDKTNIPRTAEIQYYCGIEESIIYVKETSTCNYEVAISTNRLCKDPVFNPQIKESLNSILCYLYKTDDGSSYNNSLSSEDYDYDDDNQTMSEKLSEIHKKYKKENMKKASDIFKNKWMKSVNYKGKKVVVKPHFSEEGEEKERKKENEVRHHGHDDNKNSEEIDPAQEEAIKKIIRNIFQQLNESNNNSNDDDDTNNENNNENNSNNKSTRKPLHFISHQSGDSPTKRVILKEIIKQGGKNPSSRKYSDPSTKQIVFERAIRKQKEEEEKKRRREKNKHFNDEK
jgi:protein OS-9